MVHAAPKKYKAFISYRHLSPDKEIAHALHRLLEHNMIRPHRGVKRNIRPVFLDTSELPLLSDLNQGILQALEQSECLIVVCSPNLPLSRYCMAEINYFKELHGGSMDRIFTILVDGEPAQAFPEALCTTVKTTVLPDGSEQREIIPAEPLFADVRGKNLRQSLRKLRRKEYLRIAAACYGCTFDQLYKRQQRWIASVTLAALMVAGLIGAGFYLNSQTLATGIITTQVQQLVGQSDELLALTLASEADFTVSPDYQTALRNALVQYDYKLRGAPASSFHLADLLDDFNTVRYLSDSGDLVLTYAGARLQVTDAASGAVLLNEPQDQVFVTGNNPDIYVRVSVRTGEDGVMRDWLSVYRLSDSRLMNEFSFRETMRSSGAYQMNSLAGYDGAFFIADQDKAVACFTREGIPITNEEFLQAAFEQLAAAEEEAAPSYSVVQDKMLRSYVVKDASGQVCLTLGKTVKAFALSPDSALFAWADDTRLSVYDTAAWEQIGQVDLAEGMVPQKLYLLHDSTYYISSWLVDGITRNLLADWKTDTSLLSFTGMPLINPMKSAFYTAGNGRLMRYNYRGLDLAEKAEVVHHVGDRCLSQNNDAVYLIDSAQQALLLRFPTVWYCTPAYDPDLTCILLRTLKGLYCFSGDGTALWEKEGDFDCPAVSCDGSLTAWVEESGDVIIAEASTGREIQRIASSELTPAGAVNALALSEHGLCVSGESGVLWFPADEGRPIVVSSLGYDSATLFSDGVLVLESAFVKVQDFLVYDTIRSEVLLQPESNTGRWAYSPVSGYLVRQVMLSNDQPTMTAEVLRRKGDTFDRCGEIALPFETAQTILLDDSGKWITIRSINRTLVYQASSLTEWLNVSCPLYQQSDKLYAAHTYGADHYSIPMYRGGALLDAAREVLSTPSGVRELTSEECLHFGIDTP